MLIRNEKVYRFGWFLILCSCIYGVWDFAQFATEISYPARLESCEIDSSNLGFYGMDKYYTVSAKVTVIDNLVPRSIYLHDRVPSNFNCDIKKSFYIKVSPLNPYKARFSIPKDWFDPLFKVMLGLAFGWLAVNSKKNNW